MHLFQRSERRCCFRWLNLAVILTALFTTSVDGASKTEKVFLITIDGLRWQEVFTGAELLLLNKTNGGVVYTNRIFDAFWRDTPEERRRVLLPFFWEVIAPQGQLYGNQLQGSVARVTNGRNFTYPGFNEILAGFADDRINQNAKRWNPNVTVLEWLHWKPAFTNRVAALANWDVFPYILNTKRSGIPMWSGYETNFLTETGSQFGFVEEITRDMTPVWPDMNFDSFFFRAAMEYVPVKKPRVLWIAFSETDEWAHETRYDLYLLALHRINGYLRALWEKCQSLPEYRGKTTFILTCDHGRGDGPREWRDHGAAVKGAENIWLAVLGPDTAPLGERENVEPIGQNQIAATLAALLGEDYRGTVTNAGLPIRDILPPSELKH